MKKVLLSIMFAGVASFASAQKSEINEAKKTWNLLGITSGKSLATDLKTLNGGLARTDLAIANEKSKVMAEAWVYRALFASRIALIDSVNLNNAKAKQKIADEAITKAEELDKKGAEKENIAQAKTNVENAVRNRAIYAYRKKDFKTALEAFKEIIAKNPNDTSMYVNAGVTAKEIQNYPEVIKNFKKATELNYPESKALYSEMINITMDKLKDSVAGLKLIQEAAVKYPEDSYFIGLETDLYIKSGDISKSQEMLKKLIAKDPKNAVYQYLMGETYYKQALAIQNKRNALDVKKKKEFDAMTAQMNKFIDESVPYFKKALEIDPKNVSALENLKIIYMFKNDTPNYEDMKKRLDAIKQ
ncbi:hypothetical protein ABDJ41_22500 [Pedobacter sp. ASV1-7]|uniref:hypothetical protein n=1 Tax=Pedobacter sp. ASV1-7 TaxID=3145237 RepID=UPI0032E8E687